MSHRSGYFTGRKKKYSFTDKFQKVKTTVIKRSWHSLNNFNCHNWTAVQIRAYIAVFDGACSTSCSSDVRCALRQNPCLQKDNLLRVSSCLFADDSLYGNIRFNKEARQLQYDQESILDWELDLQMPGAKSLSTSNTVLSFKTTTPCNCWISLDIISSGHLLRSSPRVSFDKLFKQAKSTISFIRRNITSCWQKAKSNVYRPSWSPPQLYSALAMTVCEINWKFHRRPARRTSSVNNIFVNLKWESVQRRRNVARVIII